MVTRTTALLGSTQSSVYATVDVPAALFLLGLGPDPPSGLVVVVRRIGLVGHCVVADPVVNPSEVGHPLLLLVLLVLLQLLDIAHFHMFLSPASLLPEPHLPLIAILQHFPLINPFLLFLGPIHHKGIQGLLIERCSSFLGLSLMLLLFYLFALHLAHVVLQDTLEPALFHRLELSFLVAGVEYVHCWVQMIKIISKKG